MFPWNMFSPFLKNGKNMMNGMNPDDIQNYVQNMMKQTFPEDWQGMMNPQEMMNQAAGFGNQGNQGNQQPESESQHTSHSQQPIQTNVFETFEDVYIRMKLPEDEWINQLKVFHTSNQAIFENIPEIGDRQVITLPSLVKRKGASCQYKEGILEMKIPRSVDLQYTEVDIAERY